MRHKKTTKILDRKIGPRKALIKNLAGQLVIFEKIRTTKAKAKVLRPYVEKLITKSAENNLTTKRYLKTKINLNNAIKKLLEVYGPQYKDRKGGYLKIIKADTRKGDGAEMVYITFVK